MKYKIFILAFLLCYSYGFSQCVDPGANVWTNSWESCQPAQSPNANRGMGHWIEYDLGASRSISKVHVWNANNSTQLNNGFRNVTVDYSRDGVSWTELGSYEFPQGVGSAIYGGFEGFDLRGERARYVLITANSNWGGSCYGLAEVKFNLMLDINNTPATFPVEWLDFTATQIGPNEVELNWTTALEQNNMGFQIERSLDGISFQRVGEVPGAGNSMLPRSYNFLDGEAEADRLYYRLRQIDLDGASNYSDIREVRMGASFSAQINLYPNPVNEFLTVSISSAVNHQYKLRVLDIQGKTLFQKEHYSGSERISIPVSTYSRGMYIVDLTDILNNQHVSRYFVKR
ncbi:MAG: T9SS type A sorting domain-containing protein [Bacteroidota bacterium]